MHMEHAHNAVDWMSIFPIYSIIQTLNLVNRLSKRHLGVESGTLGGKVSLKTCDGS